MIVKNWLVNILPERLFAHDSQKWVRYLIISGVFVISIVFAIKPNLRLILLVDALILFAVAAVILLRRIQLGILAIIIACFFIPTPSSSGIGSKLIPPIFLILFLIGLWFVDMVARERQLSLVRSRTLLPAIILLIVAIIAFLNGQIRYYNLAHIAPIDAQLGGLMIFVISIAAFLLASNLFVSLKWLERFTWIFLVCSAIYIFSRIIPFVESIIRPLYQKGSDASLFWVWLVCMAASQALFNHQLRRYWRWVLMALVAATFFVGMVQAYDWKSGWFPAMIALFAVVWIGYPRFRVPGLVVGALLGISYYVIGSSTRLAESENYSILTRLPAWSIVLEIVKANPILGLGFSNYYWYTPLFPILGYSVYFNSHNNYVDIIAQVGLVGLACLLWFLWEVGRLGWDLRNKVPDGFSYAFVIGALGGLIGTLVSGMLGDWFLPFVYNVGLDGTRSSIFAWLFLGGLVALEQIYRNPSASTPVD
jgi:O-antigen ligase